MDQLFCVACLSLFVVVVAAVVAAVVVVVVCCCCLSIVAFCRYSCYMFTSSFP